MAALGQFEKPRRLPATSGSKTIPDVNRSEICIVG